jgi:2,5-dihydroxypyridine 5,6-dioxygenase
MPADPRAAGAHILTTTCAALEAGERAVVLADEVTREAADQVAAMCRRITEDVQFLLTVQMDMHGREPSYEVADAMLGADVIFAMTSTSLAHSQARFAATNRGARYLSLPGYSLDALASEALRADFRGLTPVARAVASVLDGSEEITISSVAGTALRCSAAGRRANAAPGWCDGPGSLASPPDAEANVAPLESSAEGVLMIDGSVTATGLGRLQSPIEMRVTEGRVTDIRGVGADRLRDVLDDLGDSRARVVAEVGLGLNPLARISGWMLEDEGVLGSVHIGLGANATIGGVNDVSSHVDHVLRDATVSADGVTILRDGRLLVSS